MRRVVSVLLVVALPTLTQAQEPMPWPEIGMTGAEAAALFEGACPSTWQPAPYLTCVNGQNVVTATSSDKDRIYYIQRLEETGLSKADYAAAVAGELGFDGAGQPCDRNNTPALCWTKPDGNELYAAMDFNPGVLATQLVNPVIKAEDAAP